MTVGLSKFLSISERVTMALLLACGLATVIWGALAALDQMKTRRLSKSIIQWMDAQQLPDRCYQQGEIADSSSEGMPCLTKNGYRFISGIERTQTDNQSFKRVVRITGQLNINANDIILSQNYNYKLRYEELSTRGSAEMEKLVQEVPEIMESYNK